MSIDLQSDELLTLSQACHQLPRTPAPATLWRWRTRGVKVGERRIRLECVRVGGQWMTTREAFTRFLQEQTDAALVHQYASRNEETERDEATNRRLSEAGLV